METIMENENVAQTNFPATLNLASGVTLLLETACLGTSAPF
jgi:hypothetical protein